MIFTVTPRKTVGQLARLTADEVAQHIAAAFANLAGFDEIDRSLILEAAKVYLDHAAMPRETADAPLSALVIQGEALRLLDVLMLEVK